MQKFVKMRKVNKHKRYSHLGNSELAGAGNGWVNYGQGHRKNSEVKRVTDARRKEKQNCRLY